jgi:hypothetical protein
MFLFVLCLSVVGGLFVYHLKLETICLKEEIKQLREDYIQHVLDMDGHSLGTTIERREDMEQ